jgi:hypothetical protein
VATVSHALYGRLSGYAGLTSLVATRIYPGAVPQEQDLPFVAFVRTDEDSEQAFVEDADIDETLFEITSFGATYDSCEAVHEQVRAATRRFRGTFATVEVTDAIHRGGEGPISMDDPKMYEATQLVAVRYRRP